MNTAYSPASLAEGAIKAGMIRLAGVYPFHAAVLRQLRLTLSPAVGTMGVTADMSGVVLLLFNPDFVLPLPAAELGGVLLHEVHHIILNHLLEDPAKYPDRWARTVAEEVTVNEFVKEPLPTGGIHLGMFPLLPEMESTDERYQRLSRVKERFPIDPAGQGERTEPAEGADGNSVVGSQTGALIDNHAIWEEARNNRDAARQAVAAAVQQAVLETGGVPFELEAAVRSLGVGTISNTDSYALRHDRAGRLDWKRLLRNYVGEAMKAHPTYDRPPRRCPELVGLLPGRRQSAVGTSILAVVDTSGSITDETLEQIDGELRRMGRTHTVHVVECDCAIQRVSRRVSRLGRLTGRGGTDFRPPLAPAFLRRMRAQLVVYFTDGIGPAPETAPPVPVVWCLVAGGQAPAPWGRVISMDHENGDHADD